MQNLLIIKSSVNGANSVSNQLIDGFVGELLVRFPDAHVNERDLGTSPVESLRTETVAAIGRPGPEGPAALQARELSDKLIEELVIADTVIIGAPMYNFGIAAGLKAWFDLVVRAGSTFSYGANGPAGLVPEKPVFVIESNGGIYSSGPYAAYDFQEPHLKALLGFIGLGSAKFIRAEGLAIGQAEQAIAAKRSELKAFAQAL